MEPINIVSAAVAGDKESFMAAFNSAIANRITDALEVKKIEVASQLLNPNVETANEIEADTVDVGGRDSATNET